METGDTFKNLVNTKSTESALMRVLPGDLEASYLYNKLVGMQAKVGGGGQQMPLGSALVEKDLQVVRTWILECATNN